MYFVRMSRVPIPVMKSLEEAEREMPKHLMYGIMHGYQLRPIQALLSKVRAHMQINSWVKLCDDYFIA